MQQDIKLMVEALVDAGLTEGQIAKEVKTTQPNVHRIKNGSEPKYKLGCRIVQFYQEYLPNKTQ